MSNVIGDQSPVNPSIPVVILCGGKGTRIRDAGDLRPKPMLDIGGRPILWHIMRTYAHYGFKDFVLALGYLGEQIKNFVLNYKAFTSDFTVTLGDRNAIAFHNNTEADDWRVTCVDTGPETMTGGRVWRVRHHIHTDYFLLTYGDGVSTVDIPQLVRFHRSHGKIATVTGVHPPGRFGDLLVEDERVVDFSEKRQTTEGFINGGFFVFQRAFIDRYLDQREELILEREPLERLAQDGQLMVYKHRGFWQCMDTFRDYQALNRLWDEGQAPWKVWS